MAEHDDTLVMRRSKRATAGNRMEAALAEFRAEDVGMDVEEDVDFVVVKDEEDAFESDFESTDEEAQEDINVLEERKAWDDERQPRKGGRSKLDRVTAAAHARQKATFNPQVEEQQNPESHVTKVKRRVSMGSVVDAETGEVVEGTKRQSRRSHTMQNTSATASRMKDAEEKKSTVPKKAKTPVQIPTQRELMERALKMEKGNIKEHREYLSTEEEKRRKARLVRTAVQGPLIRWISKIEEVTVRIDPPPPPTPPTYAYAPPAYQYYSPPPPPQVAAASNGHPRSFLHVSAAYHAGLEQPNAPTGHQPQPQYPVYPADPRTQYTPPVPSQSQATSSASSPGPSQPASHPQQQQSPPSYSQSTPYPYPYYYYHQYYAQPHAAPSPAEPIERTEKVTKNYVIHELSQEVKQRPPWHTTMKAMFGDHVKWEELRVYTSKGRPLSRPVQHCPITGKVAIYRDPRTNVPFADVAAYDTLTKVLEHEFVWNDSLACYVG